VPWSTWQRHAWPGGHPLLAELKGDSGVSSLIGLLRIEGAGVPAKSGLPD
jgi:hypothetical protein